MAKRPSNFSDLLRVNFGQAWAPGMMDFNMLTLSQPLQIPKRKLSVRAKKRANWPARLALNKMFFAQPSPAPSTSPYEKPPMVITPWKSP